MKSIPTPVRLLSLLSASVICAAGAQAQSVDASLVSAESSTDGTGGKIIYNATTVLTEGEATAGFELPAGSYLVLVSSDGAGGGAKVSWSSATCAAASETKYFYSLCVVPQGTNVLTVSNPSTEWKGDEAVHIVLKRVGASITTMANGFVLANEVQNVSEGGSRSFTLPQGGYEVDVSSDLSGMKVVWEGLACPTYSESKNYMGRCAIPAGGGTVTISNPNAVYKGAENATILIKRSSDTFAAGSVVAKETQTVAEGTSRSFTFTPGRYKLALSGVLNGMNVSWSKSSCVSSSNTMDGTYPCTLPNGGTLTLKNPDTPWWMGDETVGIKVTKTQ
jgi:hypothetical protein